MSSNNQSSTLKPVNNSNPKSNNPINGNKLTNLSNKVNNITNNPNNLVINNSKCNETLKVNFKPNKNNNNKNNPTDNSEGKMACIIS